MSRSRHPQCPNGRGCGVCGDAGAIRRMRESDVARTDAPLVDEEIENRHEPDDGYECDGDGCPICGCRIDADMLPPGVTFTEAT